MSESVIPVAVEADASDQTVSTRETPWTKIGALVDNPMNAEQAAELGGINFTVSFYPVTYTSAKHGHRSMPSRTVVERDDTGAALGVVSSVYKPLQYGEAFNFMDEIEPTYVAAGALQGGRQAFMVVRPPSVTDFTLLAGEDPHDMYVILRTSHDCTRAVEVALMPLRHKCMNMLTLRGFSAGVAQRWSVKHIGDVKGKLAEAQKVLANVDTYLGDLRKTAEKLASKTVSEGLAEQVLRHVIRNRPQRDTTVQRIIDLWKTSPTVGWSDSAWGLVNAVSDHYDWRPGGSPTSRFISALQGQTHTAINKTAAFLLSRV